MGSLSGVFSQAGLARGKPKTLSSFYKAALVYLALAPYSADIPESLNVNLPERL